MAPSIKRTKEWHVNGIINLAAVWLGRIKSVVLLNIKMREGEQFGKLNSEGRSLVRCY